MLCFLRNKLQCLAREPSLLGDTTPLAHTGRTLGTHMNAVVLLTDKLCGLRRLLASALESLPNAAIIYTHDDMIRLANGHSVDLAGQTQAPGRIRATALCDLSTLPACVLPDPSTGEYYWTCRLADPTGFGPVELQAHDGRLMLMHAATLRNEAGRPADIIANFVGITPIRQAERHRGETLRFISRDMRPSQSATLVLIELQRDASRVLDREVLLSRIEQLSSHTLELTDAFIDLVRAESQTPKLVDVGPVGLMLDATDRVRPLADRHQVEVRAMVSIRAAVRGKLRLLVRILVNLLNNATKFNAVGLMVMVSMEQDRAIFSAVMVDRGADIALTNQSRLLQPFYRLYEGAANAPIDSSLGSVLVKTAVDRHSGRIAA